MKFLWNFKKIFSLLTVCQHVERCLFLYNFYLENFEDRYYLAKNLNDYVFIINKNITTINNLSELLKTKDTINKANINNHLIKLNDQILKQEEAIKKSI